MLLLRLICCSSFFLLLLIPSVVNLPLSLHSVQRFPFYTYQSNGYCLDSIPSPFPTFNLLIRSVLLSPGSNGGIGSTSFQVPRLRWPPCPPHMLTRCTFRSLCKPNVQISAANAKDHAVTPTNPKSDSSRKFFRFIP
jgi:hypothetical protein